MRTKCAVFTKKQFTCLMQKQTTFKHDIVDLYHIIRDKQTNIHTHTHTQIHTCVRQRSEKLRKSVKHMLCIVYTIIKKDLI